MEENDRYEFEDKYGSLEAALLTKIKELELFDTHSSKSKTKLQLKDNLPNHGQQVQTIELNCQHLMELIWSGYIFEIGSSVCSMKMIIWTISPNINIYSLR